MLKIIKNMDLSEMICFLQSMEGLYLALSEKRVQD